LPAFAQNVSSWLRSLFDRKIIIPFSLLLASLFVDAVFLRPFFTELDILEHFLFGFIISEGVSKTSFVFGLQNWLVKRSSLAGSTVDALVRLSGFLLIGGFLWETFEYWFLPLFGVPYNPFFAFPITLHNIDGTVDVAVGALGCLLAWVSGKED
jgi:hypothetical protein